MEVTGNLLAQLFPILIVVALGFVLLLVWIFWISSRRNKSKRATDTAEQNEEAGGGPDLLNRASGTIRALTGTPDGRTVPPSAALRSSNDDAVEVFRVLRDLADGSLVVEIEGKRYTRLAEITDGQVGRRFVANARALAHYAMILKGPPPPAPPREAPTPSPGSVPEQPQPVAAMPPPQMGRTTTQMAKEAKSDEQPAAEISLADQIEELLQYRLSVHPSLALRSIHVRPSFGGGVRIVVDDTSYEDVAQVPEQEVREFIQATIREWNARN